LAGVSNAWAEEWALNVLLLQGGGIATTPCLFQPTKFHHVVKTQPHESKAVFIYLQLLEVIVFS
jgi:hypothetical protein